LLIKIKFRNQINLTQFCFFKEEKMDDTSTDWQSGKSLSATNAYMLVNELGSDITFRMGATGERVLAHKYMLVCFCFVLFLFL
jgi:hypothetical protein